MTAADAMPSGTSQGTPQVLLAHHLKQLRPPTVLREYDKVARECARDGVDHPRYLLRLLKLELIDRERRLIERRIRQARFLATKNLDSFVFTVIRAARRRLPRTQRRLRYHDAHGPSLPADPGGFRRDGAQYHPPKGQGRPRRRARGGASSR